MKLVIEYDISDGFTCSTTKTRPIQYESAEALVVDFERSVLASTEARTEEFTIAGVAFSRYNHGNFKADNKNRKKLSFSYSSPRIMTIDEWFDGNNQKDPK
jgi:hypothetical protein